MSKTRDLRQVRPRIPAGLDDREGARVVERRDLAQAFEGGDRLVVEHHGRREALASVDHAVRHGLVTRRGRFPGEDLAGRARVVRRGVVLADPLDSPREQRPSGSDVSADPSTRRYFSEELPALKTRTLIASPEGSGRPAAEPVDAVEEPARNRSVSG